ncbi:MAG: hypothetical protein QXN59_01325 [Candidatus Micrarchaeaceae archaeon]
MAFLGMLGKKSPQIAEKFSPYMVTTEWFPYKFYSNKKGSSILFVKLKNLTNEPLLTSFLVELPGKLSFDEIGLAKEKLTKVGEIKPMEEKELRFNVFNSIGIEPGEYTVTLTTTAHYQNYDKVINVVRKRTSVGVV